MTDEEQPRQPPMIVKILFWSFVLSFFGGGAILFANLFWHFLPQSAFAFIALIIMAELVPLLIVGIAASVIGRMRAIRRAAEKFRNSK